MQSMPPTQSFPLVQTLNPALPAAGHPLSARLVRGLVTLVAAALLLAGLTAQAQTYLVDFGGANTTSRGIVPNDPDRHWNNVGATVGQTDTGALSNLVSSLNTTSSISLVMVRRFNGVNENGTQAALNYPLNATRDSMFGNTGNHAGLTNIFPGFKLTGLDPATVYSFTFYASRTGVGDNRETGYTVTGGNSGFAALDPANNIETTATVANITPDGAGEITIDIGPTVNNNNSVQYTYLGILQVDAVPPQTPLTFTRQPISQWVVQSKPVTFTCEVSGSPPHFAQWFENGSPIFGANQLSHTIPSAELYMNGWFYSVTVSNLAYGVTSSNAVLTVGSDTNPPVLLSAASYDGFNVRLVFNEQMDFTTYDTANYQINGGAVQVASAILEVDGRTVTLGLSAAIAGTFTVVVNRVQDLYGNPIVANTSLTGEVIPLEEQDLLFDFGSGTYATQLGPSPDDPDRHWNNVTTAGTSDLGEMPNLITVFNMQTPIGLSMIRRFNGANTAGTLLSTLFPPNATQDSLYGNTEEWQSLSNIFPSFKLTGLDPARRYSLLFYASRTGVSDNRETGYSVEGAAANFAALDPGNNLNRSVTVEGISPTAGGEITISIAPTVNNNNSYHFTYLGVMRLSLYTAPLQFLPPVIEGGKVKLNWTGTGQLQRATTVTGPWTPVEPAPTPPYEEDWVPGENWFYRLQK